MVLQEATVNFIDSFSPNHLPWIYCGAMVKGRLEFSTGLESSEGSLIALHASEKPER